MPVYFGPAGNSDSFTAAGYKSNAVAPEFVAGMGLNAYEYQCGNGVTVKEKGAKLIGEAAEKYGVKLSIHAPYYITMAGEDEDKRLNSIKYILQSAEAASFMGADRVIFHPGGIGKQNRETAFLLSLDTLKLAIRAMDEHGYGKISLCPEVMGKINQLGDIDEVATMCSTDERLVPCIDFGHYNARTHGALVTQEDYEMIFDKFEAAIGYDRTRLFHSHFSRIQYSKGGEVKHLTFEDNIYGPYFEPLAEVMAKRNYEPYIICESAGTQAEDACNMKKIYEKIKEREI